MAHPLCNVAAESAVYEVAFDISGKLMHAGPVNEEAITRIWIANRDGANGQMGNFSNLRAP